jgi:hypothetical protein
VVPERHLCRSDRGALKPPLDRAKDVQDGSIGSMLDTDVHLVAIFQTRDALRADDERQPLGK